jgi:SM-20-related protein
LRHKGWFASDQLVPPAIADQLLMQLLINKNLLTPALIGKGPQKKARPDIRGDSTLWLERENHLATENDFFNWLDGFKKFLNEKLLLGLKTEEMHYAFYPTGAGYKKHIDCFEKTDQRVISFALYLNKGWSADSGGEIALYKEENPELEDARISPTHAQCVVFLSASIYHEVIFTRSERYSVTGWLKKAAPSAGFRVFEP